MISYFKEKIFSKIALLFLVATIALILSSYYVLNWEFIEKDNILDAHDAYFQYKLVQSWNLDEQNAIVEELKNLSLLCSVYINDKDDDCNNDVRLPTVFSSPYSSCDYYSNQNSGQINLNLLEEKKDTINFQSSYVSFGQVEGQNGSFLEASVVEFDGHRYLLVLDGYAPPNEFFAFIPSMILASLFMLALYLLIRRFLFPISLIQNRMVALEAGDLDSFIDIHGEDELALLSKKFNHLVSQIKALLDQKESLLSEVSHELRTPLSKIKLLLELERTDKNKIKINNQIEYLDSLITNILIADKMSAPYSELNYETIEVSALIKKSIEFSKTVDLKLDLQANCSISVDVVKMSVAIKNLLDNAYKYAQTDAGILITSSFIKKNVVSIAITDSGPGIPKKLLATIMNPFVQGDQQKKSGFGLGLAISKKVLLAHRGNLLVQNNKIGCTFTLEIPIQSNE